MRRIIPALAVGLTALLTACGTTDTGPEATATAAAPSAPATSAAADPVVVLERAMDLSSEKSFSMDVTVGTDPTVVELAAAIDPATGDMTLTMVEPDPMTMLITADFLYLKEPGEKTWMRVERDRLNPDGPLGQAIDVRAQTGILGGLVSAEPAGDGRYTGTADVDKAVANAGSDTERESLEAAAKVVKNRSDVPFEATVDAQGRLTFFTYTFDTPAGRIATEMKLHSFGEPVTVKAPPASLTTNAPDQVYQMF